MVSGPNDPHLGETATLARDVLRGRVTLRIHGGMPVVDARDVAAVHAAVRRRSARAAALVQWRPRV